MRPSLRIALMGAVIFVVGFSAGAMLMAIRFQSVANRIFFGEQFAVAAHDVWTISKLDKREYENIVSMVNMKLDGDICMLSKFVNGESVMFLSNVLGRDVGTIPRVTCKRLLVHIARYRAMHPVASPTKDLELRKKANSILEIILREAEKGA